MCTCMSVVRAWLNVHADVQVPKTATVAELKEAVEDVFSQLPMDKEINISWYVQFWSQLQINLIFLIFIFNIN